MTPVKYASPAAVRQTARTAQGSRMSAPSSTPTKPTRRQWAALAFVALGVAMIILDGTVVNVALPSMIKDLDLTTNDAEWVTAAYSLVFAALLILSGRMSDRFGRRRLFLLGVVVFVVTSVMVGLSDSSIQIIAARSLQGIGAALMLPSSLGILNATFTGRSRAVAFAVWGGTIGGMAALGPLVGGWLTTYASWHWAFFINVPFGIAVVIGVLVFATESRDSTDARGIDLPGTVLSTLGLLGIVFALIEGQRYGWFTPKTDFFIGSWQWPLTSVSIVFVSLVVGILCVVTLVVVDARREAAGKVVVLSPRLFSIRSFGAGNAVAAIVSLGEFGLLFTLPLFLQTTRGYDAMQTGVILLALALGAFVASGGSAPMSHRMGPVRVLQLGMLLEVIGIAWLGFAISTTVTGWMLAPGLFLYGMGVGFATAQLTGVILSEVPVAESGQASAVQSTARQVGAAIGTAILGTVLIVSLGTTVQSELEARGLPTAQAEEVANVVANSGGTAILGFSAQPGNEIVVEGASAGFATATKTVAAVAALFIALGLLNSLQLPRNAGRVSEGDDVPAPSSA